MKEKILELHKNGYSYNQIAELTGASKGTIAYHCSVKVRKNYHHRASENRRKFKDDLKKSRGGKCEQCGYDKCLAALEFHHPDDNKEDSVSNLLRSKGQEAARKESEKCVLICANCHREKHDMDS